LPASVCSPLPRPDPLFASALFVCLLAWDFVCLLATGPLQLHAVGGAAYAARAVVYSRSRPFRALLRRSAPHSLCVRWCAAASPAEPLPHKRTAPLRMR
jgi:hypothetical protein